MLVFKLQIFRACGSTEFSRGKSYEINSGSVCYKQWKQMITQKLLWRYISLYNMVIKFLLRRQRNFLNVRPNKFIKRSFCNQVSGQGVNNDNIKYLLILDFEATCDIQKPKFQEIIEFPCLKINLKTFEEEGRFHHYVKPEFEPILSTFCIELTGILQEMVDQGKTFSNVFQMFEDWRTQEGLTEANSLYITSGDWDLGHMLPQQCALSNIKVPSHMKFWVDIKKLFGYNHNRFYNSFINIMHYYRLQFLGRSHSGIDDCLNILQVVQKMGRSGIKFIPTSMMSKGKVITINSHLKEKDLRNS